MQKHVHEAQAAERRGPTPATVPPRPHVACRQIGEICERGGIGAEENGTGRAGTARRSERTARHAPRTVAHRQTQHPKQSARRRRSPTIPAAREPVRETVHKGDNGERYKKMSAREAAPENQSPWSLRQ